MKPEANVKTVTGWLARLLVASATLLSASLSQADELPLWEVGAGVATLSFPAYRGSDESQTFAMPVPYFVYRGEFLKADKDGIRGQLFKSDTLDLTLSAALSPPAFSDDIVAREGMPDLEATFEAGPQLNVTFWRSENKARHFKLLLPLRKAYTVERSPKDIGWVFHPKLNVDVRDMPGWSGWNLGMLAGPVFGDRKQHDYFYSVAPGQATANRSAYSAKSGYGGMQYLAAVSKRYPRHWVGAFVRYDDLRGATFANSPLVRDKSYWAAGFAVSWIFGQSSSKVVVGE